jgi:tetratricopeptide (TPR) repeat protein
VYKVGEEWSRQKQENLAQVKWEVAIAHHKRALELAPSEDYYYLWAGSAYLEKSKSAPEQGCFITGTPNISAVLGMTIEETARLCREDLLTSARTILLQARHVNPLNTDHSANLGRLYKNWADMTTAREKRAERLDQSIGYYKQAAKLSPQNTIVWNELATVYLYQQGNLELAWETIEHSLQLDDQFEQTYMIAGDARWREADLLARQLAAAQQELSSAEEDDKAAIEAEIERLKKEQNEKLEAAITAYERALEIKPRLANIYPNVATAYEQLGRLEEAVETFEGAVAASPSSAEPHIGLAELYQRMDRPGAAIREYRQAIALKPGSVNYRLALAEFLQTMQRYDEALVEVQEAVSRRQDNPVLRQRLAMLYRELQMYPEALAEAKVAAQLAPNDPTSQLLVGDLSQTVNDLSAAAAAYEQALVIAPNLDNAWRVHWNLALIYQAQNNLDLALTHATAALNSAPEGQRQQINDVVVQLEKQISGSP